MFYDQMTAAATLEQAAQLVGYDDLREQQKAWRAEGRLVGIGVSLLAEPSAIAFGWMSTDGATVRVGPNGRADVLTSAGGHGQSLETTIAQVVADELGIDVSHVRVLQGDTDATPTGPGTGGSRSAVIAGGAAHQAAREVRARIIAIAANELRQHPTISRSSTATSTSPAPRRAASPLPMWHVRRTTSRGTSHPARRPVSRDRLATHRRRR
jgi:carbon-monoxide dehydrogenase large subunit